MLTTKLIALPDIPGTHEVSMSDVPLHPIHMIDVNGVPFLVCLKRAKEEVEDDLWKKVTVIVIAPDEAVDTGDFVIAPLGSAVVRGQVLSYFMVIPQPPQNVIAS